MNKPIQQRTLKTRARLVAAAQEIIEEVGHEALRTEEVVKRAKVAKGTFFAHFPDKDALLDLLIGEELNTCVDALGELPPPTSVEALVAQLMPLLDLMSRSRMVFDVIIRYSGAAAIEEVGPIAENFGKQLDLLIRWFDPSGDHPFRRDISPELMGEGVQAFAIQAIALNFCNLHNDVFIAERLTQYLRAWLLPST